MTVPTVPQAPTARPLPTPAPPTNTLAILSLVFAFLFWPLSILFGHMARGQIKRSGENGNGLATAGLVISYAGLVGFALIMIGGAASVNTASPALPAAAPVVTLPVGAPSQSTDGIGDGTYVVGTDIQPGTYRTAGPRPGMMPMCIWQRLANTTGDMNAVTASDISNGPTTVTINESDGAFKSTGCATWAKVR